MNRVKKLFSLLVVGGIALQCKNRNVFQTGAFEGEKYALTSIETKGFSTNSFTHELKWGGRKAVKINVHTTDWGPPYSDDLYGTTRRVYISPQLEAYQSTNSDTTRLGSSMLYLSPERFSRQVFDDYARFMTKVWSEIDKKYAHQPYSSFPKIIGLVYGNQDDFRLTFKGEKEGQAYIITVEPDGRIRYTLVRQYSSDEYSGLSDRVQMPGKRIFVSTNPNAGQLYDGVSMAQLAEYKNATGKTLGDYFKLMPNIGKLE